MVEAKHNVQQAELRANMSIAVRVLAQRESESFAHRDIVAPAHDYIAAHPELR